MRRRCKRLVEIHLLNILACHRYATSQSSVPMASVIKLRVFFPPSRLREGGWVIQRSVDRVGKYARDINANALAVSTHPDIATLVDPLSVVRKEGRQGVSSLT